MLFGVLFAVIFFGSVIFGFSVVALTVAWLCLRAVTPEGEAAPRWGDLRPLTRLSRRTQLIFRLAAVAAVAGFMAIPAGFIYDLTMERYYRYQEVIKGISSTWGDSQTVVGPVLMVPYTVRYEVSEAVPLGAAELALEQARSSDRTTKEVIRTVEDSRTALVLPEELSVDARVATELRSRGIYSTRVYTADMAVSGAFAKTELSGLRPHIAEIRWDDAEIVIGISSTKAIRDISELSLAGEKFSFLPGTGGLGVLSTGFSSPCDISSFQAGETIEFGFRVSVGGSESLFLAPVGGVNSFRVSSEWPHPNFTGSGLPSFREITASGFEAEWDIPNLVRNYPQAADSEEWAPLARAGSMYAYDEGASEAGGYKLTEYVAGVEFFEPVFHYSLLIRAAKYAVLFIALMYLGVAIFENYSFEKGKTRLGMIQYCVIGLGLSMFYLTLLALSEHTGFTAAYLAAAAINMSMTAAYVGSALKRGKPAVLTAGIQGALYVLLFFILRMEDYSLLAGSAMLLVAVAALMMVTRGMNRPGPAGSPWGNADSPPGDVGQGSEER
ncbi:MAG: cell envelope integrity protein CreD [Synergistaceae bacterium]|jgi:inner membrane protein|nr:cell envelope integrity protein CreD [Synergistaceae bacterium]